MKIFQLWEAATVCRRCCVVICPAGPNWWATWENVTEGRAWLMVSLPVRMPLSKALNQWLLELVSHQEDGVDSSWLRGQQLQMLLAKIRLRETDAFKAVCTKQKAPTKLQWCERHKNWGSLKLWSNKCLYFTGLETFQRNISVCVQTQRNKQSIYSSHNVCDATFSWWPRGPKVNTRKHKLQRALSGRYRNTLMQR